LIFFLFEGLLYVDTNGLKGDMVTICEAQRAPGVPTPIMVADCLGTAGADPEITCECCFKCCEVGGECNSDDLVPSNDPMWQFGYDRVVYSFGDSGYFMAVDTP
jgi:hypothetical protein